jgi:hypothetical protein
VPLLAGLFRFGLPSVNQLLLSLAAGITAVLIADLLKLLPVVRRALGLRATQRA